MIPITALTLTGIVFFTKCDKVQNPARYEYPPTDTITYVASTEDFANPERGFYRYSETNAANYAPLSEAQLKEWRTLQPVDEGNYKVYSTLVFRYFILKGFNNKALSSELLEKIKTDFGIARQAGVKLIPRFTYTVKANAGNCPEGFICPPYGDAPKNIVLQHIEQLKPILKANADVIACLQMGFIGTWGESYYTDHFGDPSSNGAGQLYDNNWNDRFEVLKALLDALPADRMVQVRYPQMKQRFVYGVNAPVSSAALTDKEAFNGAYKARIGLHNDCFIASSTDYGTFEDYGNSSSPRGGGSGLRIYSSNDNKYVVAGGETCDETYSPYNNCENAGKVQTELNSMHYSYLNSAYNNKVNNIWVSGGCMENIKKNLGYRLVLEKTIKPKAAAEAGKLLFIEINMRNEGYASPFNPRVAKLVLRNQNSGKEFIYNLSTSVQNWHTGKIKILERVLLDAAMTSGKYNLYLYLPDKYESLAKKPEYAIRFANNDVWDATTGYNNLKAVVTVK